MEDIIDPSDVTVTPGGTSKNGTHIGQSIHARIDDVAEPRDKSEMDLRWGQLFDTVFGWDPTGAETAFLKGPPTRNDDETGVWFVYRFTERILHNITSDRFRDVVTSRFDVSDCFIKLRHKPHSCSPKGWNELTFEGEFGPVEGRLEDFPTDVLIDVVRETVSTACNVANRHVELLRRVKELKSNAGGQFTSMRWKAEDDLKDELKEAARQYAQCLRSFRDEAIKSIRYELDTQAEKGGLDTTVSNVIERHLDHLEGDFEFDRQKPELLKALNVSAVVLSELVGQDFGDVLIQCHADTPDGTCGEVSLNNPSDPVCPASGSTCPTSTGLTNHSTVCILCRCGEESLPLNSNGG